MEVSEGVEWHGIGGGFEILLKVYADREGLATSGNERPSTPQMQTPDVEILLPPRDYGDQHFPCEPPALSMNRV